MLSRTYGNDHVQPSRKDGEYHDGLRRPTVQLAELTITVVINSGGFGTVHKTNHKRFGDVAYKTYTRYVDRNLIMLNSLPNGGDQ